MKKIWKIVAILLLLVLLAACDPKGIFTPTTPPSNSENTPPSNDPVTTDPPIEEPPVVEPPVDTFEDYGLPVIEIYVSKVSIAEDGLYTSMAEVAVYLHTYHRLPGNFVPKSMFNNKNVTQANKLSCGGDVFGNYEKLLPVGKTYRECDINYHGGGRGVERIVFSGDGLVFYTSNHYKSFSIVRFFE